MSKMFASLVAALTLTAGVASAETYDATQPAKPSQGYVGVTGSLGAQRAIMGGMSIDGGKRIGDTPLFVRGQMTGGKSGTDGSFVQLRGGVEARSCVLRNLLCAFAGTDAGYQRDHMIDDLLFDDGQVEIDAHDALLVPRVGVEAGTKIRLRTALEMPLRLRLDNDPGGYMDERTGMGLALSFGVAGVF